MSSFFSLQAFVTACCSDTLSSITALILLVPSVLFMIVIERFLKADVLSKVGQ